MQASIFSCSTAFLAWEMLAVLLLAMPSFIVLLLQQRQAQRGWGGGGHGVNEHHIKSTKQHPLKRCLCPPVGAAILHHNRFFYLKGPILSGESVKQQPSYIFSSSSQLVIFSVNVPAWLFVYWLFLGWWWWWWGYKEIKHQNTPLWSNVTIRSFPHHQFLEDSHDKPTWNGTLYPRMCPSSYSVFSLLLCPAPWPPPHNHPPTHTLLKMSQFAFKGSCTTIWSLPLWWGAVESIPTHCGFFFCYCIDLSISLSPFKSILHLNGCFAEGGGQTVNSCSNPTLQSSKASF